MDHLITPLKDLGLTEKEARVYLALLQLGAATPYKIAKKSRLKRPTAYVIAEELVEKGLIVHVPGEEPRRYIARTPETFFEGMEEKLAKARRILPELKSLQKGTSEKPSVMYFDGVEGLRQAYEYREKDLHGKNIVGFFASAEDISPEVNQVFFEWNEYINRHKTHVRGLTVDSSTLKPYAKWLLLKESEVTMKYLPQEIYSAKTSIESCDDQFVRICLMESVQTLIIESPKLARAIREVFEITWKEMEGKYDEPRSIRG
jgi:DNA-binding MarR family transcriptional regulator